MLVFHTWTINQPAHVIETFHGAPDQNVTRSELTMHNLLGLLGQMH